MYKAIAGTQEAYEKDNHATVPPLTVAVIQNPIYVRGNGLDHAGPSIVMVQAEGEILAVTGLSSLANTKIVRDILNSIIK